MTTARQQLGAGGGCSAKWATGYSGLSELKPQGGSILSSELLTCPRSTLISAYHASFVSGHCPSAYSFSVFYRNPRTPITSSMHVLSVSAT